MGEFWVGFSQGPGARLELACADPRMDNCRSSYVLGLRGGVPPVQATQPLHGGWLQVPLLPLSSKTCSPGNEASKLASDLSQKLGQG